MSRVQGQGDTIKEEEEREVEGSGENHRDGAGDQIRLVECLLSIHKSLGTTTVGHKTKRGIARRNPNT